MDHVELRAPHLDDPVLVEVEEDLAVTVGRVLPGDEDAVVGADLVAVAAALVALAVVDVHVQRLAGHEGLEVRPAVVHVERDLVVVAGVEVHELAKRADEDRGSLVERASPLTDGRSSPAPGPRAAPGAAPPTPAATARAGSSGRGRRRSRRPRRPAGRGRRPRTAPAGSPSPAAGAGAARAVSTVGRGSASPRRRAPGRGPSGVTSSSLTSGHDTRACAIAGILLAHP